MLKAIRRCFDFARLVLMSGRPNAASNNYSTTPYWLVKEEGFTKLIPGTSKKSDVLRELGVPLLKSKFPRQGEEVWEYRYLEGTATLMLAHVYFDPNGTYKYSSHRLDPVADGGG